MAARHYQTDDSLPPDDEAVATPTSITADTPTTSAELEALNPPTAPAVAEALDTPITPADAEALDAPVFSTDKSSSSYARVNYIDSHGATEERQAYSRRDMYQQTGKSAILRYGALVLVLALLASALVFGVPKLLGLFTPAELPSGQSVAVFIPEGSSTRQIAQILKDAQVISSTKSFIDACDRQGVASSLKPGRYDLTTGMPIDELIDALVSGPPDNSVKLTIPEGLTIEQTAARVELACAIPAADFLTEAYNAAKYEPDFPFLAGCYNNSLEGFLYPKTYQIPRGANAEYVVRVLLTQFGIETMGVDWSIAAAKGLSPYDVLVIASLIERETYLPDERQLVSSVIYNRLGTDMRLQIDATIIYALADSNRDYQEQPLLYSDLEVDSPYNTYRRDGLPPGPICSPQILSILAAAEPGQTNYLYYVMTSTDGHHTFCITYEEFEEANKVYRQVFGLD